MKYKPNLKRQIGFWQLVVKDIVDKNKMCSVTEMIVASRSRAGAWKKVMNRISGSSNVAPARANSDPAKLTIFTTLRYYLSCSLC